MKITLHKNQGTVFQSTSRFKVVAAGRRFGKTVLACIIVFIRSLKDPGIYWIVAPTYGQAKELAWDILLKMIPREMMEKKPNESELKITLKNGSTIHLKGADNPDTLVGRGLKGIVIDEVAKIRNHKRVWEEILRPSLSDYQGWGIFISTPKGKDYFWELWLKGQRKEDGFESWQFKSSDNPFIKPEEIEQARKSCSETYFRQEWEASFEDFTGLIWPEYDEKIHLVDPFEIPSHWETLAAIDTAVSGTTAALKAAVDEDGKIFITNEYYEQNKRVSEVAEAIKGWKPNLWYIDPAAKIRNIRTQNHGDLYSLYDEYKDNGIVALPAENEVYGGINRVGEYYKSKRLFIFKGRCPNLEAETQVYHWSEQKELGSGMSKPAPFKSFDHAVDCKRYIVSSRASSSVKIQEKIKSFTERDFERMEEQQYADEAD